MRHLLILFRQYGVLLCLSAIGMIHSVDQIAALKPEMSLSASESFPGRHIIAIPYGTSVVQIKVGKSEKLFGVAGQWVYVRVLEKEGWLFGPLLKNPDENHYFRQGMGKIQKYFYENSTEGTAKLGHLTWLKCPLGGYFKANKCLGNADLFSVGDAINSQTGECTNLNLNGKRWRTPTIHELLTLKNDNILRFAPADANAFFWSSSIGTDQEETYQILFYRKWEINQTAVKDGHLICVSE